MDDKKNVTGYSGPYRGRNDYYRDGSYTLLFIINLQAIIMGLLALALAIYLCTRHNTDRYFAETVDGRAAQMAAQHVPNMSRRTIANWAATAASEVMTFGFDDIDKRFEQSRTEFTPEGWVSFRKGVINAKLIDDIVKTQQISTAVPLAPPHIVQEGLITGKDGSVFQGWVFDVPLLITFRAGADIRPIVKKVHMVIKKVPTEDNPYAVAIAEWDIN